MVKPSENGSQSIAPFLKKCYEMVDDESSDAIISWSQNNDSFIIWDMTEFSVHLLPKFFKHSNFSSFIRQLNIYVSLPLLLLFNGYLTFSEKHVRIGGDGLVFEFGFWTFKLGFQYFAFMSVVFLLKQVFAILMMEFSFLVAWVCC